jgi:serine/threonine protein kinase
MKIENALPEGYQLHQYRIAKTIGGGGFSIVYLARNGQNGQWVVIKEYLPDKQAARVDGESVETLSHTTASTFNTGMKRFFDEAMALSKINHPNIVRVVDFFRENNTVYMVMNYEDGKDLRWYIKRHNGRMTEKFIRFPPVARRPARTAPQ